MLFFATATAVHAWLQSGYICEIKCWTLQKKVVHNQDEKCFDKKCAHKDTNTESAWRAQLFIIIILV